VLTDDERMRIEWRCRSTAAEIIYHLDRSDFEAMVHHYTEDAVFLRLGEELRGRAAILEAMAKRPTGIVTRHHLTTHRFGAVTSDEAEAVIYDVTFFGPEPTERGPTKYGAPRGHTFEFHDTYRHVGDEWLLARRDARLIFSPNE
jgi:ketosteroid isomerase-like protein